MNQLLKKIIISIITFEAKLVLRKYEPTVIAVTGSVGKTSTKDAIYTVLSRTHFVRKSGKSFNSEIGVPLTILGCENAWGNPLLWLRNIFHGLLLIILPTTYPEWLVLEVGADHPGDIKRLSSWLRPDIAVLTRVPDVPVHVEFFDSPEAVLREKKHLSDALIIGGSLVVYGDDEKTNRIGREAKEKGFPVFFFGMGESSTIRGSQVEIISEQETGRPTGIRFTVKTAEGTYPIELRGTIGHQHIYAALAAVGVGEALGLNMTGVVEALGRHETPPGRMRLLPGFKGSLLIDDSYNSSPAAAHEALSALAALPKGRGRKIAVLGDMLELGKYSPEEHRLVGKAAAEIVQKLVTVGFRARDIADGALVGGLHESAILQFEDSKTAGKELERIVEEGDVLLIKGSQSIRMERTVEELMAEPESAERLLVRQDPEWRRRT